MIGVEAGRRSLVARGRGLNPRRQIGGQELAPQGAQQLAVEPAGVLEADFELGRMDVDVDQLGRHLEHEEGDGKAADHQEAAIGLAQRMLQGPVADVPPVEKEILHPVMAAALAGMGHVAGQLHLVLDALDPNQVVGQLAAEALRDPLQPAVVGGQLENLLLVVPQGEMHLRHRQGNANERLGDVAELRHARAQKLPPHGRVEEQVLHLDRRADRAAAGGHAAQRPAAHLDFRPAGAFRRAAPQHQPAHFGDRGQRLAAEAERADAEQVVGLSDFARGVAGQGQRQLLGRDAAAVIDDPHHFQSALAHRNVDARGTRVDGILHQFLDHAGRPFDDLAGGDFVDQGRREEVDGHGGGAWWRGWGLVS